jgi:tetratricopeptide (TPR) repeat protein
LTDSQCGRIIWAERFHGRIDDIHSIRASIRTRIVTALEIAIPAYEAENARLGVSESLDAWSAYHLGLQHMYRFNRQDNAQADTLFQLAVAKDPAFARAYAGLSFVHFQTAFLRNTHDVASEADLARKFAERAMDRDPLDPFVNFVMGRSFWLKGDLDNSLGWLERSTNISPNYAQGIYARAWTEALSGEGAKSRENVDLAMRLSPLDPLYYAMLGTRALSHMTDESYEEAARWAERAARSPGAHVLIAMIAVATHALAGDDKGASRWADDVRRRNGTLTKEDFFRSFPVKSQDVRTRASAAFNSQGFT